MAKQFISIPLPNHPGLIEAQNYLRRLLPEGTTYQDPAKFHLTLVYIEDDKGMDFAEMRVPEHLPVFGFSGCDIRDFRQQNDDLGSAVHLRFWPQSPQLHYLQSALYYEIAARGGKVSAFSYPGVWKPHITLAYAPGEHDCWMESPQVTIEVREFALTQGDYEAVKTWGLRTDVPIQEAIQGINFVISEAITGKPPKIKIPKDFDVEASKKALKVDELVLDVRPIGIADGKSRNGRVYTRESVESLVEQVNRLRPEGHWGHIKPEEIGSFYGPPAVRWLAAEMDKSGVAWGLMLALTEEARQHVLSAKAANARIGTSIYAINPVLGQGVNEIAGYDLVKIDLANAELVGVPEMSTVPELVLETVKLDVGGNPVTDEEKKDAGTSQNGTGKPVETLLREQLHEANQTIKENRPKITEHELMCELLGNADNPVQAVKEMKAALDEAKRENAELIQSSIAEAVNKAVLVESARDIILESVIALNPTTRKEIQPAVEKVMARDSVKKLLATQLVAEMGPPHGKQTANDKRTASTDDWFEKDEEGVS